MPSGDPGPRRGEQGYTLALMIGILTVMAIAVAAAIPAWSAAGAREREEELIARGFQYAEAIRVFQQRFGRLPNRLDELVEIEPRSIRRLWEDPMPDGGWLVILEGPGGQLVTLDPETGEMVAPAGAGGGESRPAPPPPPPGSSPSAFGAPPAAVSGPIHGVKSRVHNEAYHKLFDRQDVGEWEFTVERLVAATAAKNPDGLPRRAPASWIGRPFRYPPQGGIPGTVLPTKPNRQRPGARGRQQQGRTPRPGDAGQRPASRGAGSGS